MKKVLFGALLGAAVMAAAALAQTQVPVGGGGALFSVPFLQTVGPNDAIQDIQNGYPTTGNTYVSPQQIAGAPGYTKTIATTGFSQTFANGQEYILLYPAATLATGTITTEASPVSDGQRECIRSSQIVTALTLTANAGQTINSPATALAAGTSVCWTFSLSNSTWDPS